jgi:ABC-type amino acid transport substrate-binding protein
MPFPLVSQVVHSAQTVMDDFAPALTRTRAAAANLALTGAAAVVKAPPAEPSPTHPNLWIAVSPAPPASTASEDKAAISGPLFLLSVVKTFAGVLSCSEDPLSLDPSLLMDAARALADAARGAGVTPQRLTAVIGPVKLLDPFMSVWGAEHGLVRAAKPLLHMYLAHVEPETLRPPTRPAPADVEVGLCTAADVDVARVMCERFSARLPRPLDATTARAHAQALVDSRSLFGARVGGELRCIVAVMRPTPGVKAVSMVWSDPEARGHGLAELVVRHAVTR